MNRVRKNLSFANIVSLLALFVALGGVSYAAVKLPAKSVGSKQLQNGAVTLPKISTSAKNSLRGSAGEVGPVGTTGPKGANGEKGDSGATGATGAIGSTGSPGLSHGHFDRDATTVFATQLGSNVATTSLDAGHYLLSARIQVTGSTSAPVRCALKNPSAEEIDDASIRIGPEYLGSGNAFGLSAPLTLASSGQVTVFCSFADVNNENNLNQYSFVTNVSAVQVSSLNAVD